MVDAWTRRPHDWAFIGLGVVVGAGTVVYGRSGDDVTPAGRWLMPALGILFAGASLWSLLTFRRRSAAAIARAESAALAATELLGGRPKPVVPAISWQRHLSAL
ncbi:hypothetical protein B7486_73090 [cyanobacterium TDX16]|nr:hypothetical protein B7486_73090 [cyanobacterium TDX16]